MWSHGIGRNPVSLGYGVMVAQQILVLLVQVQVLLSQLNINQLTL